MRLQRKLAIPVALALAGVMAAGCLQVVKLVTVTLGTLTATHGAASVGKYVVLADESSTYKDNKSKFKDIEDVAVLGTFRNLDPTNAVSADVWIVSAPANQTLLADTALVKAAGGVKVWSLALAGNETRVLTWDASSALFTSTGKQVLKDELKGDGTFTLYVFGNTGTYNVQLTGGSFDVAVNVGFVGP